ncbi:PREDICTED: uncharacterized protein LOC104825892 [Tarenaya hassleriana]|uniref:uncharacterized protein LOC104825892 n=1 Tax=Tarenaya hassleriana TaxID=28532 RepID=UPI00053C33C1|nr:PREDICTED: uncharacterized protein LOC104825892 [Tarenaya hassleriana]
MQMVLEQLAVLNAKFEDSNRPSRTRHLTPTQEELGMYALDERVEGVNYVANNSYSNTYNPGWKNHPNLSYKSNNVENLMPNNFRASNNSNQRISPSFAFQSRGPNQTSNYRALGQSYINATPPGNPESNPDTHILLTTVYTESREGEPGILNSVRKYRCSLQAHRQPDCSASISLSKTVRISSSGKQVDAEDRPMVEQGKTSKTAVVDIPDDEPKPAYVPPPPRPPPVPFPSCLRKHNEDSQFAKFVEMLKKLEVTMPFTDAILQIPSYTKYLKDILTKKRVVEKETIALTADAAL